MNQEYRQRGVGPSELDPMRNWPITAVIIVVTAVLAVLLQPVLQGEVASGLIFVLGIMLVGANSGLIPALVCAVASAVIFNFFLADPMLTFRISKGDDLAPPIIFTLCALISGVLSGRLRDRTSQLGKTNLQLESLLATSQKLQSASDALAIQAALKQTVLGDFNLQVFLFENAGGRARAVDDEAEEAHLLHIADQLIAGLSLYKKGGVIAHRLEGTATCVGALIVELRDNMRVDLSFLSALASVVGLALERAQFATVIAETRADLQAEGFKSVLLSSVSHDLRTPLTTISASASSLIDYGSRLDGDTSRRLLEGIVDECERLNSVTANLLELSRLQSGGRNMPGQILPVGDVIRSVTKRLRQRAEKHSITVSTPGKDIFVRADFTLFESAITNVIQNAIQYSSPGSDVEVKLEANDEVCDITITDSGCGIDPSEHHKVMERFYRVKRDAEAPHGSGLGLAIAKGFVEAFCGSIHIRSPIANGRGTAVTISLPVVKEGSE